MMAAPIQMQEDPERRRRRAPLPVVPMPLVDAVAYRFMLFHAVQGGRLDPPEPQMRAAIGHFLMVVAGPIRANSKGRREVYRGVRRLLARTEHPTLGGAMPGAATLAGAPHTDTQLLQSRTGDSR